MIKDMRDGAVMVTCNCGTEACSDGQGPGAMIEVFPGQDCVTLQPLDGQGERTGMELSLSLCELRRALDGERS